MANLSQLCALWNAKAMAANNRHEAVQSTPRIEGVDGTWGGDEKRVWGTSVSYSL